MSKRFEDRVTAWTRSCVWSGCANPSTRSGSRPVVSQQRDRAARCCWATTSRARPVGSWSTPGPSSGSRWCRSGATPRPSCNRRTTSPAPTSWWARGGRCSTRCRAARPAYVYDVYGGDGWVTPETYDAIEADSIAGQALPRRRRRRSAARRPGGVRPDDGPGQPGADPQAPRGEDPRRRPRAPVSELAPRVDRRARPGRRSWRARFGCAGGQRPRCSACRPRCARWATRWPRLASEVFAAKAESEAAGRGRAGAAGRRRAQARPGPRTWSHAQGEGDAIRQQRWVRLGEALRLVRPPMSPTDLVPSDRAPALLVAPEVVIPDDAVIGANVVIRAGVELGRGVVLEDAVVLGKVPAVGSGSKSPPGRPAATSLGDGTVIGSHTVVSAGATLGPRVYVGDHSLVREGSAWARTARSATRAPSDATPSSASASGCRATAAWPRAWSSRTTASSDRW